MKVYDAQGKPVVTGEVVGRGGEATVYRVNGRASLLAKIYEPAPRTNYPDKLRWMVSHPPQNPTRSLSHPSLAWPAGLLLDSQRRLVGYMMPHIQSAVPILDVFNPRRRAAILPRFDRRYLHRSARNLAAALGALHSCGYVAGDLNESNVLVTPSALVTLIDTDSYQVREMRAGRLVVHYCPVGKLEYTPPELHGKSLDRVVRLPDHDAFALAVLIFQLLMEGNHPFRAQWLASGDPPPVEARIALGAFPYVASPAHPVQPPKNGPDLHLLHPDLSELVRRCFVDGHRQPQQRPSPAAWERALAAAEKALRVCSKGHHYSNHLPGCPVCSPQPVQRGMARPAVSVEADHRSSASQPARAVRPPSGSPAAASKASSNTAPPPPTSAPRPMGTTPSPVGTSRSQAPAAPQPPASSAVGLRGRYRMPAWRRGTWRWVWSRPAPTAPGGWNAPSTTPALQTHGVWNWARPKIVKSVAIGGGIGALAGALPGALLGVMSWSAGEVVAWSLLWALGGVAAGILRGWRPGVRLSQWVQRNIGWQRVLPVAGLLGGAFGGGVAGFIIGWWAIIPVFLGLIFGGRLGWSLGRAIWRAGNQLGWERVWAVIGAAGAAGLGWTAARWVSDSGVGLFADHYAGVLALWLAGNSLSWVFVWAVVGGLGGALGGAIAGTLADLCARLVGLTD